MASQKYNILYGRLSQEDERQRDDRQKESNSIHNQKLFLEQYAADHGFENTLFLADDGYSGTNFDRPAWKKVIEMVERDEVETIIVKDLSRLGREYPPGRTVHGDLLPGERRPLHCGQRRRGFPGGEQQRLQSDP